MENVVLEEYVQTLIPYRQIGWENLNSSDRAYYKSVCSMLVEDFPEFRADEGQFKWSKVNALLDTYLRPTLGRKPTTAESDEL